MEGNSEDIAAALQRGETVPAVACQPSTVLLPAGEVRVEGHAGRNLVVDTLQLISPAGQRRLAEAARLRANHRSTPPRLLEWGNSVRRLEFGPSTDTRLLVVPESVNPGWQATLADGRMLQPTTANGWQQAWLVPANSEGVVTLRFTPNTPYRTVLGVGGVLVLLLIVLTVVGGVRLRRLDSPHSDSPLAWRWSAVTAPSPTPASPLETVAATIGPRFLPPPAQSSAVCYWPPTRGHSPVATAMPATTGSPSSAPSLPSSP
ncbi:MAG: hypothetical protein U1U88_001597 [Lawsonella clevelandensis]